MFDEHVAWAAEAGVDFIIAETIAHHGEAKLALASILQADWKLWSIWWATVRAC